MTTYSGAAISAIVANLDSKAIWVTDTAERARRYANAQATGVVTGSLTEPLAEGAAVLEVEAADVRFRRRSETHSSLDQCEDHVHAFRIVKITMRPCAYENTIYGPRFRRMRLGELLAALDARGIEVVLV